jgi:hypothetical protein
VAELRATNVIERVFVKMGRQIRPMVCLVNVQARTASSTPSFKNSIWKGAPAPSAFIQAACIARAADILLVDILFFDKGLRFRQAEEFPRCLADGMRVRILYHDHCFDGAASAAFFSRFVRDKIHPGAEFAYTGMAHTASQTFAEELFDGDENAIVDFKYAPTPKLTWWFDHHQSAFLRPEDVDHWRQDTSGKKLYDPSFRSCTMFICSVTRERWSYDAPDLNELVTWADIIDGALYRSAEEAVAMREPAMQLTLVIEGSKGSELVQKIIGWMQRLSLAEIMRQPEIQEVYVPLQKRHLESIDIIRRTSINEGGVVFFDLIESGLESYNKFIPYDLHPDSLYTVSVSNSPYRSKVSVGSNPWAPAPLTHNLATICERYGGGGHAKVGAISFEKGAIDKARAAAAEIVAELKA